MLKDKTWLYFVISIIILFATTPIRYESLISDQWATHIIYFIAVFLSVRLSNIASYKIPTAYAMGFLIPYFTLVIIEEFSLLYSLNVFSYLLAMLNGYLFATIGKWWKKGVIIFTSALYCYLAVNILSELFLHYENHGTWSGRINNSVPASKGFITEVNDTLMVNSLNPEKILVLDIWSTSCGVCFKQFPLLESIYNKYKDNDQVIITAMNVPIKRDTARQALNMIRNRNYTFPVSYTYNGLDTALNVYAYPATIVIHNNRVIYRGDLKSVEKVVNKLL